MEQRAIKALLERVAAGETGVDEALLKLKLEPYQELGYAKLDSHRGLRQGVAEVIYGAGKTPEQIAGIVDAMRAGGQETILITRMSAEAAAKINPAHPFAYHEMGRIGIVGGRHCGGAARPRRQRQSGGGHRRHQRHAGGGGGRPHRPGPGQ